MFQWYIVTAYFINQLFISYLFILFLNYPKLLNCCFIYNHSTTPLSVTAQFRNPPAKPPRQTAQVIALLIRFASRITVSFTELFEAMLCTFPKEQLATIKQAGFYTEDREQPPDQSKTRDLLLGNKHFLCLLSFKPYC